MSARLNSLVSSACTIAPFSSLPLACKLAIVWHMAVDGCAWDGVDLSSYSEDELVSALQHLMPRYDSLYGATLIGWSDLPCASIQAAIMHDPEINEDFTSWDDYHAAYLAGGGVPNHPESDRWPVILSSDDSETVRDGWHRLHSYIRDGAVSIPAVFFAPDSYVAG